MKLKARPVILANLSDNTPACTEDLQASLWLV